MRTTLKIETPAKSLEVELKLVDGKQIVELELADLLALIGEKPAKSPAAPKASKAAPATKAPKAPKVASPAPGAKRGRKPKTSEPMAEAQTSTIINER